AGHHSSTDKVGAFCGLNSVSIGAVYAIQFLKLDRVLVLDWIGISNSTGAPLNCHLIDMFNRNQLTGDDEYFNMFAKNILPDIIQFQPSLILISAGFDAAQGEAEQCAQLTPNEYFQMTKKN
ncbi:unnamed protein product, partial [Rotaria magnacalcarata]